MVKCLVTGAAGFIGSHLVERLLRDGYEVVGVDSFLDFYPRRIKERNLEGACASPNFTFCEGNLLSLDLPDLLENVRCVFHQGGQAAVRASWGKEFKIYTDNNIFATQQLLEACREANLQKFIFASSSSVYGDVEEMPLKEEMTPRPVSPYGVSKLACEHLCYLYWKNYQIPTVSLRYFTVFGPRQRPDMSFHLFIKALLGGQEITVYGDGEQTRDFTYISDAVEANILAMKHGKPGELYNIGGGSRVTMNHIIQLLEEITSKKAAVKYTERQKGDVKHTYADVSKALRDFGFTPKVRLKGGLEQEVVWLQKMEE